MEKILRSEDLSRLGAPYRWWWMCLPKHNPPWQYFCHHGAHSAVAPVGNSTMQNDELLAERERRAARKRADSAELALRQVRLAVRDLPPTYRTLVLVKALEEDNQGHRLAEASRF
jgi:hypothetical protein